MQRAVAVSMKKTFFLTANNRDCSQLLFSGTWLASSTLAVLFMYCVTRGKIVYEMFFVHQGNNTKKLDSAYRIYRGMCIPAWQ